MAYNPRTAMEKIYEFKGIWEDADKVGDVAKKNEAAKKAQQYYSELKNNGYGTVANNLQKANYSQASKYLNNYKIKSGNVQFRNYMYENLKPYGVTNDQVDKLTGFDPDAGEVTFAGRNIGKGEGIADNRTYFKAQDLDNIIKDFTSNQGLSRSPEVLEGVHNEKIDRELDDYQSGVSSNEDFYKKKYEETDDYNKNFNPYNSEIGKAIMEDYKHMGEVEGGNALADGAGSNEGNIDSFAAANAARQQLEFTNAGKQMVLADFNSRVGRAKEMLSDLGVQLRGFNSDRLSGIKTRQYESQRLTENRYNNDKLKEEGRQFDESIKQADRALSADNQNALAQIEAQNRGAIEQIEAQTQGEKEIIQENAKYIGGNTAALEEASNGYAKSIMENFNTGKITHPIKSLGNGKYSVDESKKKEFAKYVIDTYMDRIDDDTLYYMLTTSFNIDTDIIESVL